MPTIKIGDSSTTIVFGDGNYVDKLVARDIVLNESTNAAPVLQVDFAHYAKRKRGNLEDSDFEVLQRDNDSIAKLTLRDPTIAKKVQSYANIGSVEISIGENTPTKYSVKSQQVDNYEVVLEF